jgi:outer membrane protein assembly factor BamB/calcineurin-like phosphoesterase family protein
MNLRNRILFCLLSVFFLCFSLSVFSQTATYQEVTTSRPDCAFSFAVFADTHISMDNEQNTEDLRNAVADVNMDPSIAFVIVIGDVSFKADYESLKLAKSILDKLNCRYLVVPGNHDTRWSESGTTAFKRVFGDDKFRLQFNGYLFLGVNSSPVMTDTDGHIAPQDIVWMQSQLKNIGKKAPVFVVSHYPLKTGDVDNWFDLTDVIRKHNVQAVLGGHYHRNMINDYDGIIGIINRSIIREKENIAAYSLYQLCGDSLYISDKYVNGEAKQWAVVPIEQKMYVEGDAKFFPRPDYTVNGIYKNAKERWTKKIGYAIYCSPTIDDKTIYFGDDKGVMHAVSSENGKEEWKFQTGEKILSSPVVYDGNVVFGSCDGNIYCLDAKTGEKIWNITTGKAVVASPVVKDGIVYIGSGDGKLRSVNIEDGVVRWTFDEVGEYQESKPVIADNRLIFGAWDNAVYALNINNGDLLWKWNQNTDSKILSPAFVSPVVSGDMFFVVSADRTLTAINMNTGKTLWSKNDIKYGEAIGISDDGKSLYCRALQDTVLAFNLDGSLIWNVNIGFEEDRNPSVIEYRNGQIVFTSRYGEIICMNANDGSVIWKHKIGNTIINDLSPIAENDWIVTTADGIISRITIKK